jgi:hypothetical protein
MLTNSKICGITKLKYLEKLNISVNNLSSTDNIVPISKLFKNLNIRCNVIDFKSKISKNDYMKLVFLESINLSGNYYKFIYLFILLYTSY